MESLFLLEHGEALGTVPLPLGFGGERHAAEVEPLDGTVLGQSVYSTLSKQKSCELSRDRSYCGMVPYRPYITPRDEGPDPVRSVDFLPAGSGTLFRIRIGS